MAVGRPCGQALQADGKLYLCPLRPVAGSPRWEKEAHLRKAPLDGDAPACPTNLASEGLGKVVRSCPGGMGGPPYTLMGLGGQLLGQPLPQQPQENRGSVFEGRAQWSQRGFRVSAKGPSRKHVSEARGHCRWLRA